MNLAAINPNVVMIVIGVILAILLIYLFFQYLSMKNKVNRLTKKYKYFMTGEDGKSIELKLSTEVRELREMLSSSENMLHQQELLATMQLQSYQKTGLVRYDAFDDTGDKLSFSLCVLDGKNDGFILSWQAMKPAAFMRRKLSMVSAGKPSPRKKRNPSGRPSRPSCLIWPARPSAQWNRTSWKIRQLLQCPMIIKLIWLRNKNKSLLSC